MRERNWSRATAVVILLLTAAVVHGQCVTTEQVITQPAAFPSRVAGPIASTGSILGLAKSDTTIGTSAIFFATYDGNLNPLIADRPIVDLSLNGATSLIWNGSEFGLFYQTTGYVPTLQRINANGNPVGAAVPILNHPASSEDEFDFAWSPVRNAYGIARTVTLGVDSGLWLTVVSKEGAVIADTAISAFITAPVTPQVIALPDGSFALTWIRNASALVLSIFSPSGALKSAVASERTDVSVERLATDGSSILIVFAATTATGTELRYAQYDLAANRIKADSSFLTGSGVAILPFHIQWNPVLSEWTLTYNDSFGPLFPSVRLRRFASPTGTASDTFLSPNQSHSRLLAPYPIVFMGGGYIASIERVLSRQEGSESYLVKTCPFFVTAANPAAALLFTPVTFTAAASGGTPPYQFSWQFENDTVKGQVVQRIYLSPGTYTVTLTGTDAAGAVSITRTTIVIGTGRTHAVRH
ncbi:MAG TPA: PKD domain-containing protein [Thermoanaerobaculia bacterium]|nr:PKD domain-containing protein [Thermoanaerobaculia bacterium]